MINVNTTVLQQAIEADLTTELSSDASFKASVLTAKVKTAIRDVMMRRNYEATSYNEQQILDDLYNYYSVISALSLYDYNQVGANYESSHSENSVNRSWINRDDLLKGVHAFVKCF